MGTRQGWHGPALSRRRAIGAAALACGAACMGCGFASVVHEALTAERYRKLARQVGAASIQEPGAEPGTEGTTPADGAAARDWDTLLQANPACCAWVKVAGTAIDLPVVRTASETEQAWYLTHDLWGASSLSGTPFMDWRCAGPDAAHVAVYAHHMTSTDAMFSQLQEAFEQDSFERLADLAWETPKGSISARPLCALRVDSSWAEIQRFDWQEGADPAFSSWLEGIASQADALSAKAPELLAQASRCITLITCSSDLAFQPWRTLVLWVA